MMWLILFLTMITTTFISVICFPEETRATLAELKRQLRLWVIRVAGERAQQTVSPELFQRAVQAGHDPDFVNEILAEDGDFIRDRLGGPFADEILGDPGLWERYG